MAMGVYLVEHFVRAGLGQPGRRWAITSTRRVMVAKVEFTSAICVRRSAAVPDSAASSAAAASSAWPSRRPHPSAHRGGLTHGLG